MLTWYEPIATELNEVLNPPTKAEYNRMTEREQDWADQLVEGYSVHDKKDLQNLYEGYTNLIGALNMLIEMAKASRKTRKELLRVRTNLCKS